MSSGEFHGWLEIWYQVFLGLAQHSNPEFSKLPPRSQLLPTTRFYLTSGNFSFVKAFASLIFWLILYNFSVEKWHSFFVILTFVFCSVFCFTSFLPRCTSYRVTSTVTKFSQYKGLKGAWRRQGGGIREMFWGRQRAVLLFLKIHAFLNRQCKPHLHWNCQAGLPMLYPSQGSGLLLWHTVWKRNISSFPRPASAGCVTDLSRHEQW